MSYLILYKAYVFLPEPLTGPNGNVGTAILETSTTTQRGDLLAFVERMLEQGLICGYRLVNSPGTLDCNGWPSWYFASEVRYPPESHMVKLTSPSSSWGRLGDPPDKFAYQLKIRLRGKVVYPDGPKEVSLFTTAASSQELAEELGTLLFQQGLIQHWEMKPPGSPEAVSTPADADIHLKHACQLFGLPRDQITPEKRRFAKMVNFGIIWAAPPTPDPVITVTQWRDQNAEHPVLILAGTPDETRAEATPYFEVSAAAGSLVGVETTMSKHAFEHLPEFES